MRRAGDALERVGERRQVELAGVGQQQGAVEAAEELQPQVLLKALHLVADGGLCDVQLVRCLGEAEVPARCLEGP